MATNLRYLCRLPTSCLTNYDDSLEALHQVQDVVSVLNRRQNIKKKGSFTIIKTPLRQTLTTQSCMQAWNLKNGEFLALSLYREGGVRVENDGGSGGLRVELPLL